MGSMLLCLARRASPVHVVALCLGLVQGCTGEDAGESTAAVDDREPDLPQEGSAGAEGALNDAGGPTVAPIRLGDEHNYTTTSNLSIPTVETASGTDLDLCWGQVTDDIQCHELDARSDIDNVAMLRFRGLSHDEVEQKLVSTQLSMSDILGYLDYNTDGESTCARLSDLDFFGTEVNVAEQYVEDDAISYMLLFTTGTEPGVGARTMLFLEPRAESTVTQVEARTGCDGDVLLEFEASFSETRLAVPPEGPWTVDWHDVEQDGAGNPVEAVAIDSLLVGFYADMTVSEVEDRILDLQLIYTNLWEQTIDGGRSAELSGLAERDSGQPFEGFDRDETGVWVLGLMCSTCQNPAPVVFTVLDPGGNEP